MDEYPPDVKNRLSNIELRVFAGVGVYSLREVKLDRLFCSSPKLVPQTLARLPGTLAAVCSQENHHRCGDPEYSCNGVELIQANASFPVFKKTKVIHCKPGFLGEASLAHFQALPNDLNGGSNFLLVNLHDMFQRIEEVGSLEQRNGINRTACAKVQWPFQLRRTLA